MSWISSTAYPVHPILNRQKPSHPLSSTAQIVGPSPLRDGADGHLKDRSWGGRDEGLMTLNGDNRLKIESEWETELLLWGCQKSLPPLPCIHVCHQSS